MTKHSIMSGIGARASVKMPCVVNTMNPAASPISLLQSRQPIHEVAIRTPTAATRDGQSALDCVTAPPGHAASATSQAKSGGLLRCGSPPRRGRSQSPRATMSRASIGNLVSSFVARTRAPKSKRSEEHTSELQSRLHLVCRLLLEKKKKKKK